MSKYITYLRVSTKQQGNSGLGLEAQRSVVERHVSSVGGTVTAEFVEVESGKRSDRPQLALALSACKATGATLLVAKLDRLSRNVLFTATLMQSGVDFIACDLPSANRMTIHILSALAEEEARLISERTKAALAVAKSRGVKLGGYRGATAKSTRTPEDRQQQKVGHIEREYSEILPLIRSLRSRGESFYAIADELTKHGFTTPRGANYRASTLYRMWSTLECRT